MRVLNKRTDKIPPNAVYVGRPTQWGNPMSIKEIQRLFPNMASKEARQEAVDWYRGYLTAKINAHPELLETIRRELGGRDLVCWCAPLSCHADILLEYANKVEEIEG